MFSNEGWEKTEWVRKDFSSSPPRCPRVEAIEEMQRRSCLRWRRKWGVEERGGEGWKEANNVDDVDDVFSADGEGALLGAVQTLLGERGKSKRVLERARRREGSGAALCRLVRGGNRPGLCRGEETCGGGPAMRAGSLMALDARNGSCKEETAWETALRHVSKWIG